jgi:hypothetical protein
MAGDTMFMSKVFGIFMDMDAMIGADFEKGLAALKARSLTANVEVRRAIEMALHQMKAQDAAAAAAKKQAPDAGTAAP